jgi:hypothetical protein
VRRRFVLASALVTAAQALPTLGQGTARTGQVLRLQGDALQQARTFTPASLLATPADMIGTFTQSRGAPGSQTSSTVRGVRLADLIEHAGLTPAAKAAWRDVLVTVTATDGDRARFTWAELSNTPAGHGVLVVFERDGHQLDAHEGANAVLATGDLRLGPRHVRNVDRIDVRLLND